jgi:hypothetical protein
MKITINGIEYESVDTQIVEGMDVSCRDCDIFKAKIPRSPVEFPLCYERGGRKARQTCYNMACRGYKRIWKKV